VRNPLTGRTAVVSLTRNGLTIEVQGVPAPAAAQVAAILLASVREMVRCGYEELVQDAGSLHGGSLGEVSDDEAEIETRRVGF